MDLPKIEQLVDLVARSSIAELDLTQDGTRIRILKRASAAAPPVPAQPSSRDSTQAPAPDRQERPAHEATASATADVVVPAPMHGVFYRSAAPDEPPLVEVGARIEAGQKICIIEAMKTFIDIAAEVPGVVLAVLAENGDEIEAGQALFRIGPAGSS
ncbi:acetyl-CoA carboxylase biotin carboxyl carrier protein [Bradyrhizobium manausense]|uniref:acetyl-CoA carboxylase biotin carboxyl carrier protein n=1 Tax=Bradyrhizobium TaxID=374 RepID=UPI001BA75200|nr:MULTISPECIES: acetyl-CoA carboxylase biotin carboxyl carrier protein [Bradyrhizobium]MBR0825532.1 acetyl-CoA carboxylase biotin carboxyl carrier protein [Bradyrhizobium manausense]UVO31504.1 acetyl-CoA carboxylase biotin carboxyl carrier protein [Bradyrhizobium arachidis]